MGSRGLENEVVVLGSMNDLSSIFRATKKFRTTSNRSELILGYFSYLLLFMLLNSRNQLVK